MVEKSVVPVETLDSALLGHGKLNAFRAIAHPVILAEDKPECYVGENTEITLSYRHTISSNRVGLRVTDMRYYYQPSDDDSFSVLSVEGDFYVSGEKEFCREPGEGPMTSRPLFSTAAEGEYFSKLEYELFEDCSFSGSAERYTLPLFVVDNWVRGVGDFNADGVVNGADLAFVLSAWRTTNPFADLNGDGVVDGADLASLLSVWV